MTPEALLVDHGGVLTDVEGDGDEPPLIGFVRRIRENGVRTAVVSNAGSRAVVQEWRELFDDVVTSGETGTAKPEPDIFVTTARRLGVEPSACVVVDDLRGNVEGAVRAGMVGVHHRRMDETVRELAILFDVEDIG